MSIGASYFDAVTDRLRSSGRPPAAQRSALAVLSHICRHLRWQSYECDRTAAQLADAALMDAGDMARTLALLEGVGAIRRVKVGRTKAITVSPEGAFRGDLTQHSAVVQRYKLEVINGGRERDRV